MSSGLNGESRRKHLGTSGVAGSAESVIDGPMLGFPLWSLPLEKSARLGVKGGDASEKPISQELGRLRCAAILSFD